MAIVESRLVEGTLKVGTAPSELDLSCQIKVSDELDGLVVSTPERQA